MNNHRLDLPTLSSQLKHLVADLFRLDILKPDNISDYEPLRGGSLDLDSLDVLEFGLCLEETFGLTIPSQEEAHGAFASIASLAGFIHARLSPAADRISRQGLILSVPIGPARLTAGSDPILGTEPVAA